MTLVREPSPQAKPPSSDQQIPSAGLLEKASGKEEEGKIMGAHLGFQLVLPAICVQSCTNCTRPRGEALLGASCI